MTEDLVDELLADWAVEHPDKDVTALGVVVRVQHLGKLLRQGTGRALKRHGLKHWEYDVLSVLRRSGKPFEMAASDTARAAVLTSGAMTTRIDGLAARGLVRRRQSKEDGRSVLVRLTPAGKRLVDAAIDTRLADADSALARIPASERRQLAASLRRLMLAIDGQAG